MLSSDLLYRFLKIPTKEQILNEEMEKRKKIQGKSNQEAFNNIFDYFINNQLNDDPNVINKLIQTIVSYLNFREAIDCIKNEETNKRNDVIKNILDIIANSYSLEIKTYRYCDNIQDKEYFDKAGCVVFNDIVERDIKDIILLVNTWKSRGLMCIGNSTKEGGSFKNINKDNEFNWKKHSIGIMNTYIYPINIVVCEGGNHSQFTAILENIGITKIETVKDYSSKYDFVEFDGNNFLFKKESIGMEYDDELVFYTGLLFELGRLLLKKGCHDKEIKNILGQ